MINFLIFCFCKAWIYNFAVLMHCEKITYMLLLCREQYETVCDIPTRVVNEIFQEITNAKCKRMDPNQEQELLDYLEQILVIIYNNNN